jgi:hypothetical protein
MTDYTIEQLIQLNDDGLCQALKRAFSMFMDPYSELGKRQVARALAEAKPERRAYLSEAVAFIIGARQAWAIESILAYQDARKITG